MSEGVFSRRTFPADPVMEEVLADKAASPFMDICSGTLLPGDAKGLVVMGY